jgi:hypothetical protein
MWLHLSNNGGAALEPIENEKSDRELEISRKASASVATVFRLISYPT